MEEITRHGGPEGCIRQDQMVLTVWSMSKSTSINPEMKAKKKKKKKNAMRRAD